MGILIGHRAIERATRIAAVGIGVVGRPDVIGGAAGQGDDEAKEEAGGNFDH